MRLALVGGLLVVSATSFANVIDFDDLTSGETLSNQYASQGVTFYANALSGANPYSNGLYRGLFSTQTDMTVSNDPFEAPLGAFESDGNILHTYDGWGSETDGDASFGISFTGGVSSVSLLFIADDFNPDSDENTTSRMIAYDSSDAVLADIGIDPANGSRKTISISGVGTISRVAVMDGAYGEFVGVDNLNFTPVPEPATMTALGIGAIAILRKKRKS